IFISNKLSSCKQTHTRRKIILLMKSPFNKYERKMSLKRINITLISYKEYISMYKSKIMLQE
ncbi:MAG: hypothetical protein ACTSPP_08040, partial [Candidatus Heimdallarchaeaceae archaeon]